MIKTTRRIFKSIAYGGSAEPTLFCYDIGEISKIEERDDGTLYFYDSKGLAFFTAP